jgi:hypothetical protein
VAVDTDSDAVVDISAPTLAPGNDVVDVEDLREVIAALGTDMMLAVGDMSALIRAEKTPWITARALFAVAAGVYSQCCSLLTRRWDKLAASYRCNGAGQH